MIVLDASAAVEMLIGSRSRGALVGRRIASLSEVHVPGLFDLEVLSALRGIERAGLVTQDRLRGALDGLATLRARRWTHRELVPEVWRLRERLSVYDAAYAGLARLLDLPLVTADAKLARAVGPEVVIERF